MTDAIHLAPRRWNRFLVAISLLLWAGTSRDLRAQPTEPARAMGVRDILYLNKYGEGISSVSWCNDRAFSFVTRGTERNKPSAPSDDSRSATVSLFTLETKEVRAIVVSDAADISAACVRNGEYVFLSGSARSATSKNASEPAYSRFSQFIGTRPTAGSSDRTDYLSTRPDFVVRDVRTASDGSVYGAGASGAVDLESVIPSKRASIVAMDMTYILTRDEGTVVVGKVGLNRPPERRFPVYGMSAPEVWGIGSYDCSTSRPGCKAQLSGTRVGYYFYSKVNAPRARLDVVFTFMPGRDPLLQRWLVVGRPGVTWNTLVVAGVALDAKHCYVLLEPDPDLAVHRINGRLRLDLYLAQCRFTNNQIQFDEPRSVGRKQGSFIWPTLNLHGDFAVITETLDFPSQVDDQIEAEKSAILRPNVCARFYRTDLWPVTPVNTICVRLIKDGANGLQVSPDGGYVDVRSKINPLIVGREYRNGGDGPAWLNHGEEP